MKTTSFSADLRRTLAVAALLAPGVFPAVAAADQPAAPPPVAPLRNPEILTLHVRANRDGSIRDVQLEQIVGGAPVLGTIDPKGDATATPPKATWGDLLGTALSGFAKQPDAARRYLVHVAPDADLKIKFAADVHDYCLLHGFPNTDFADAAQVVAVKIAADGRATVDGRRVTPDELREMLAQRAAATGSIARVEVVIYAHPDADYGAVAALMRRVRDWAGEMRLRPISEADK